MPLPPADKPSDSPADARPVVLLRSPREAAANAVVYRRRRMERPRDRVLRVIALVGTLLVHLLVLFGAILGPAYDYEEPVFKSVPLQVRLIDKPEPPPPPPPPVRGTPPKRVGPRHRGNVPQVASRPDSRATPPVPAAAAPAVPVIAIAAPQATVRIATPAAPTPPLALPHPRPGPDLAPVPLAGTPPQVKLDTPPSPRPVPPRFQPEPVRKAQAEGNRPMPPPPSLAMPTVPAQAAPVVAPSIAIEQVAPPAMQPPSPVPVERPQAPATPAPPDVEPIPLAAPPAPAIHLTPQQTPPTPTVARERPQVQAPTIELAEPQLSPVPLESANAPATPRPAAPSIELPKLATPAAPVTLARPLAPAATPASAPASAPASPSEQAKVAEPGAAPEPLPSSAPDATPQGSDSGTPDAREGASDATSAGTRASTPAPVPGQGNGQGAGQQGRAQPGASEGAEHGLLGSYIELKPHGDAQVMDHRAPDIGYRPTRFEGDWAPKNESSLDTALRHAIDKTTVKHTFHLPRGVRVECDLSVLRIFAPFGCGNADQPAKAGKLEDYRRQYLAPARPLDPAASASVAVAASTPAPTAPVHLDNAAQCAAARVSGGPLPPMCESTGTPSPVHAPASSTSSWVPASDQFH